MAAPSLRGTPTTAAGTGSVTPTEPTGTTSGDLLLYIIHTANGEPPPNTGTVVGNPANGWTEITDGDQDTTAGGRLAAFWIVRGGSAPVLASGDSGTLNTAALVAFQSGTFNASAPIEAQRYLGTDDFVTGVVTITGITTAGIDRYIVAVVGFWGTRTFSNWQNANLGSVAELFDVQNGSTATMAAMGGTKALAGAIGNSNGTVTPTSNATDIEDLVLAVKPTAAAVTDRPIGTISIAGSRRESYVTSIYTDKPVGTIVLSGDIYRITPPEVTWPQRKLVPTALAAELTVATVGSPALRFSPDERDAERVLNADFSTEMPGGFGAASIQVSHPEFFDPLDYMFASSKIYVYESGETVHEGRVTGISESADGTVTIEIEGWAAHLSDDATARQIFYDRQFSNWQGMSVQEQVNLLSEAVPWVIADASTATDFSTGEPALATELQGPQSEWGVSGHAITEGWYDANGIELGGIDYAWKKSDTIDTSQAYDWRVNLSSTDTQGDIDATGNLEGVGPSSGTLNATHAVAKKWAFVYNACGDNVETDAKVYTIWWTLLGVFGYHQITLRGSVSDPNTGRGLYLSDMVDYIVGEWAPLLNIGDIEATTFAIPQAVFRDPTTSREMIESLLAYGSDTYYPMDWWIEEDQTFRLASPENHGRTWYTRYEDGTEASEQGPDVQQLINGVLVEYDDGTGDKHSVGPPDSGADYTTTDLLNTADDNPANRDGARHWELFSAGVTTQAGAVRIGQVLIQERLRQEWRGDIQIKDEVRDDAGNPWPAAMVRAGDYIIVADDADVRPRRIVSTSYGSAERTVSCAVGADPDRLDQLLARLGVVLEGRLT